MPPKRKSAAPPAKKQKKSAPIDDDDLAVQEDDSAITLAAVPPPPIPSEPATAIQQSYTYASPIPSECSKIDPANPSIKVPCVLGVDEAGRGPVLGPLVYGIAYCPISYQDDMKQIGFADSKALTAERRDHLLSALMDDSSHLGWAVRVMSPQDISAGMLRRRPINLNAQSSQATVSLISGVLESGVDVTEIYVDTVGDPKSYSKLLSSHFPRHPHIKWTVTSKADAIYPIVGAASIAAKVTRDRCIEGWKYAEQRQSVQNTAKDEPKVLGDTTNHISATQLDSNGESKKRKVQDASESSLEQVWSNMGPLGSGYPGDPNTVAFLKRTLDPVFGWPGIVRFSWATAKTMLEEKIKLPTATSTLTKTNSSTSASNAPALGGKRLTRSLSRTSSFADAPSSSESTADMTEVSTNRPTSLYGTLLPQPSVPGGSAPRGYKVKWIDEPVSISKFFGPSSTKSKPTTIKADAVSSQSSAADRNSNSSAFQISALQTTVNDWLKSEPQWRAKKAAAAVANGDTIQVNVGKLVKDLSLVGADGSFCL
ncbi:related to 35 kDa ribonuclease H [Ustilago trichophora]|uniref:Ribonuclease n=1 Tax=Ustilago trichophora TaxID=86804 RepID=A0A5C3ELK8_9BASI|nr:related to 35 kDa ribonuclease H [Ustilago trichophora]